MYSNILIATDGSEVAAKGLRQGLGLAALTKARVAVLMVLVPVTGFALEALIESGAMDVYDRGVADEVDRVRAEVAAAAEAAGVAADFVTRSADSPADAVLDEAAKRGADLIVVSSHGRQGLERMLLGSQSGKIVAHTDRPVLVVR
ncbi:MAG: universal stress protein [Paracoccaceae bacterium]|nr:universal stress protein [Paracoccaceae bacterium]